MSSRINSLALNLARIGDDHEVLSRIARLSLICSVGIFSSTIYAQDFKDVEGDAQVGRKTVPIIYPSLAAPALAAAILGWSAFLINLWQVSYVTAMVFGSTALFTALSYMSSSTVVGYQWSYYFYNVSRAVSSSTSISSPDTH